MTGNKDTKTTKVCMCFLQNISELNKLFLIIIILVNYYQQEFFRRFTASKLFQHEVYDSYNIKSMVYDWDQQKRIVNMSL